jgi:hypothetical protein
VRLVKITGLDQLARRLDELRVSRLSSVSLGTSSASLMIIDAQPVF